MPNPSTAPQTLLIAVGAALGLAYALWLLPWEFITGVSEFWQHGDPGSHVSALQLYLHDQWHFPVFYTHRLNYPEGVNIAFADVIPLAALLSKLFANSLPSDFHYFGFWVVFSYALQAAAACLLLAACGVRRWAWLLLGVGLFLLAPAMLFRVHAHIALTTHGVILLGLVLYVAMTKQRITQTQSLCWAALLFVVSLLIHPYLLAMVVPLYIAGLWDRQRQAPVSGRVLVLQRTALFATLSVLPVLGVMGAGGYFDSGVAGLSGGGGFGFNSMNLIAPLIGGEFFQPARLTTGTDPGQLPMPYDATGGQFEGYNYLGLGVLAATLPLMLIHRRRLEALWRAHLGLVLILLGLLIYALSFKGYLGDIKLWSTKVPFPLSELTDQFRASGRFFWPVGYVWILLVVLGLLHLRWRTSLVTSALVAILVVQWFDTRPLRDSTLGTLGLVPPHRIDDTRLVAAVDHAKALYLFPTFGCGARPFEDIVPLQVIAAQTHTPFNTGLMARGFGRCDDKERTLDNGLEPHAAYVFLHSHFNKEALVRRFGESVNTRCRSSQPGLVCAPLDRLARDGEAGQDRLGSAMPGQRRASADMQERGQ
ncbi:hypothetical protein EQG41_11140 [Billgrantia azerbaijanica]|nr:hypothetical protein EQG41_11140 [Halomonas azerbaijanica]